MKRTDYVLGLLFLLVTTTAVIFLVTRPEPLPPPPIFHGGLCVLMNPSGQWVAGIYQPTRENGVISCGAGFYTSITPMEMVGA